MVMNGYVLNASNMWTHAMKKSIAPGAQIPLTELYEQYGVKHGINEGPEFVSWLRNVKLKDSQRWKIVVDEDKPKDEESQPAVEAEVKPAGAAKPDNVAPFINTTKFTVEQLVGLSVRKGREVIPKVTDLKLLKYALQEANQLAGKDSLCRVMRKRIKELQISR